MKWWKESSGKASACVIFGLGVGGFIYPEFVTNYINPNNLSPDVTGGSPDDK